jgi:hypothetical protein
MAPTNHSPDPTHALPDRSDQPAARPASEGGAGQVEVTGIVPEGVHVDPNLTEGHPGYEESGESEIIPTPRLGPKAEGGAERPGPG